MCFRKNVTSFLYNATVYSCEVNFFSHIECQVQDSNLLALALVSRLVSNMVTSTDYICSFQLQSFLSGQLGHLLLSRSRDDCFQATHANYSRQVAPLPNPVARVERETLRDVSEYASSVCV